MNSPVLPDVPTPALPELPFLEERNPNPTRWQRRRHLLNVLGARKDAAPRLTLDERRAESQRFAEAKQAARLARSADVIDG
jgi:hypothetical protein